MGGKLRGEEQSIGKCRKEKFGPMFSMLDMDGDILYRMSVLSPECFFFFLYGCSLNLCSKSFVLKQGESLCKIQVLRLVL